MNTIYVLIVFLTLMPTHPAFDVKNLTLFSRTASYASLQECENEALRIFTEDKPALLEDSLSIVHLKCEKINIPMKGTQT